MEQIYNQLVGKEVNALYPNDWVQKEAFELKHLPGYGTFEKALMQCVEEKLRPVWANLIMEMDLNDNLLLFDANGHDDHQVKLWLNFLEVTSVPKDLINITAAIENSTFPFGQRVILMVDNIIKEDISGK